MRSASEIVHLTLRSSQRFSLRGANRQSKLAIRFRGHHNRWLTNHINCEAKVAEIRALLMASELTPRDAKMEQLARFLNDC
jgi:hypothetical protein